MTPSQEILQIQEKDIFAKIYTFLRQYPGKTLYISALVVSVFCTFLPWTDFRSSNYQNYFYFVSINAFCILYFLALLDLLLIRFGFWLKIVLFEKYRKIIEFIEVLEVGAVTMYILTLGFPGIQIGLIISAISNIGVLMYTIYIYLIKK